MGYGMQNVHGRAYSMGNGVQDGVWHGECGYGMVNGEWGMGYGMGDGE